MIAPGMRVILNADDLGMSETVNAAIFAGIDEGWVTSVSLLAHGPAFASAVAGLRDRRVSVGVHLDASEFAPGPADVEQEWSTQIEIVRAAGIDVTHLDSHQHLHYRHRREMLAVARAAGVSRIRAMGVPVGRWRLRARWRAWTHNRRLPVTTEAFYGLTAWASAGFPHHETIEVMLHPGNPHHARYADEVVLVREGRLPACQRIGWHEL